jgi:hypothetical protein
MKSKNGETTLADVVQSVHELTSAMNTGFAKLTREVGEVRKSVERMNGRFDNFLHTAGARGRDHEARIAQLELDVANLKGY